MCGQGLCGQRQEPGCAGRSSRALLIIRAMAVPYRVPPWMKVVVKAERSRRGRSAAR